MEQKSLEEILIPLKGIRNFEVYGYALDRLEAKKHQTFNDMKELARKFDPKIVKVLEDLIKKYSIAMVKKLVITIAWLGVDKIKF